MNNAAVVTTVLNAPDISCAHCAMAIEGALTPVPGVRGVTVDIPGKSVQVRYDRDQVTPAQLGEILAEEGYPVATFNHADSTASR
jgi:copper chaperone CopZ